jgi:hypothetical protein
LQVIEATKVTKKRINTATILAVFAAGSATKAPAAKAKKKEQIEKKKNINLSIVVFVRALSAVFNLCLFDSAKLQKFFEHPSKKWTFLGTW